MILNKFRLSSTVLIDVLLNVVCGLAAALFLIYLLVDEPTETKRVDSVAEAMITADWPNASGDDIDLWLLMPNDKAVGYSQKQQGEVSLERDDLGMREYTTIDGLLVPVHVNHESLFLRGLREGQYVVNVHYYTNRDKSGRNPGGCTEGAPQCNPSSGSPEARVPAVIHIQLIQILPTYKLIHSIAVTLTREGEEATAFRFFVDSNGDITSVSRDPFLFVLERKGQGTVQTPLDDPQGEESND